MTIGAPAAEVDLSFFARPTLHATERERRRGPETTHESLHAVVAPREAGIGREVLPNPLGRKSLVQLGENQLPERLALARPATRNATGVPAAVDAMLRSGNPVGGMAAFEPAAQSTPSLPSVRPDAGSRRAAKKWLRFDSVGAGGRNGWFWVRRRRL